MHLRRMTIPNTPELDERLKAKKMVFDAEKGRPEPDTRRVVVCSECGMPSVWTTRRREGRYNTKQERIEVDVVIRHSSPIRKRVGKSSAHESCISGKPPVMRESILLDTAKKGVDDTTPKTE